MAARNRSNQRDFNRRRQLILSKGHDMVFYQRGTNLSKYLFKTMPKENEISRKNIETLSKYKRESSNSCYFKQKLFLENRWKSSREPSILMQRPPFRFNDIDKFVPRYRRPLTCGSLRDNVIDTLVLARPCMKNKFNIWEGSVENTLSTKRPALLVDSAFAHEPSLKERSVRFESAVSTGGALTKVDQEDLFNYWYQMRISSGRDDKTRADLIEWSSKNSRKLNNKEISAPSKSVVPYANLSDHQTRERCVQSAPTHRKGVFITQPESLIDEPH